ncbi:MAG TPA: LapA family protein [Acidimicrobiales bacterium]|nr:LapA family protein [Acidimicrobiales bacterium]
MSRQPGSAEFPPGEVDEGVDKRLVARIVVAVVVVVLVLLFVVQNSERVETSFVFFTVETRLWVSLLVALVLGAVLGQAVEMIRARRKRRREHDDE